jgi:hypothetical protein
MYIANKPTSQITNHNHQQKKVHKNLPLKVCVWNEIHAENKLSGGAHVLYLFF